MIQVTHLRHKCIGCNACVESAPDTWVMSAKDGKSHLKKSVQKKDYYILNSDEIDYDENLEASENCPVNIIWVKII